MENAFDVHGAGGGRGDLLFPAVAQEVAVTLWSLARKKEIIINIKSYNVTKY